MESNTEERKFSEMSKSELKEYLTKSCKPSLERIKSNRRNVLSFALPLVAATSYLIFDIDRYSPPYQAGMLIGAFALGSVFSIYASRSINESCRIVSEIDSAFSELKKRTIDDHFR